MHNMMTTMVIRHIVVSAASTAAACMLSRISIASGQLWTLATELTGS